jgi:hypothetical protein
MSRQIDLSRGYGALSEGDKLYLAARGRLPKEHVSAGIRQALDHSGEVSSVAYGAHTGTVATMTTAELERELKARKTVETTQLEKLPGKSLPDKLQPGLKNPHSERLQQYEDDQEVFEGERPEKMAAADTAQRGPAVPSLGAPGVGHRTEVTGNKGQQVEEEDVDSFEPTRESGDDAYIEGWTNERRRSELAGRGLSIEGNKATMIDRLRRSDAYDDGDEEALAEEDFAEETDEE